MQNARKKTFGGDRLGTGAGFTVSQRAYERSTQNLGKKVRTNAGVGMVIPVFCDVVKRGDVWEKDIIWEILTHPTLGPMFGSYEARIAVFTGDFRLYNKQLHNNPVGTGLNMKGVIFPQLRLNAQNIDPTAGGDWNAQQISQSSLLAYTGIRGVGTKEPAPPASERIEIKRNAMWVMMYWEIYKEYIANKQEEIGVVINNAIQPTVGTVTFVTVLDQEGYPIKSTRNTSNEGNITIAPGQSLSIQGTALGKNTAQAFNASIGGDTENIATYTTWEEILWDSNLRWVTYKNNKSASFTITFDISKGQYITNPTNATEGDSTSIDLETFPLSNIDDLREDIFAQPKTSPLIIGYTGEEDRGLPYTATVGQSDTTSGAPREGSKMGAWSTWGGLGVATYKADRWNTWLNRGWIDSVNDLSAVDTSSGSFTMNALTMAKRIWQFSNDIVAGGGSYNDWLTALDGMETYGAPEMPVYRGGASCLIAFNEVVSSSQAGEEPLGTLGGKGVTLEKQGGQVKFRAEEHGMIMVIMWITPIIGYSQGNKWFTKLETMDDLHKPIFDAIGYQEKTTDQMAAWDTKYVLADEEQFFSAGYEPAWTEYMTNNDEHYGSFARENDEKYMVLDRRYQMGSDRRIEDLTTYIDPTKYLYPFAYTGLDYGPFWVHIRFNTTVRRIMSGAKQPHL